MNQRRLMLKALAGCGLIAARPGGWCEAHLASAPSDTEVGLLRSTGVRYGPSDLEILDSSAELAIYAGEASRVFLRNASAAKPRFYVRDPGGQLTDRLGRTWQADLRELVDIRRFGPAKGGDYAALLARAFAEPDVYAWIPSDLHITALNVPLPSHATVVIDGTVEMQAGAPPQATVFTNADVQQGNAYIALIGNGCIDGAKAKQSSNAQHELIRLSNCSSVVIHLARAGCNRFSQTTRERSGAAIHLVGGRNHSVSIGSLTDYGREGVWLFDVSDSIVRDTITHGGSESWSGVQVGGPTSARNRIAKVETHLAGASGIGCDSKSSLVVDCSSTANAYFHGFNFGHVKQPADDTIGLRLVSNSAGTAGKANSDFNGFSIVNGSRRVTLIECVSQDAFRDGFNTSAGADDSALVECTASGSGRYGINAYGAEVLARRCNLYSNAAGPISPSGNGNVTIDNPMTL